MMFSKRMLDPSALEPKTELVGVGHLGQVPGAIPRASMLVHLSCVSSISRVTGTPSILGSVLESAIESAARDHCYGVDLQSKVNAVAVANVRLISTR